MLMTLFLETFFGEYRSHLFWQLLFSSENEDGEDAQERDEEDDEDEESDEYEDDLEERFFG